MSSFERHFLLHIDTRTVTLKQQDFSADRTVGEDPFLHS